MILFREVIFLQTFDTREQIQFYVIIEKPKHHSINWIFTEQTDAKTAASINKTILSEIPYVHVTLWVITQNSICSLTETEKKS